MKGKSKKYMNCLQNENLISVIIPVYNVEGYLPRCIESVLKQDYKNIEIILIDDGSTDNSLVICNAYACKYKNFKVIHQENAGLSEARNRGLAIASGEYVLFLDSDDWWNCDFISKCIEKNNTDHYQYDLFIGAAQKVEAQTGQCEYIGKHFVKEKIDGFSGEQVLTYILEEDPHFEWYVWRYMYKRSFLDELNIKFKKNIYYEDVAWLPKIYLSAKSVAYVDCVFLNYLYHNSKSILNTPSIKKSMDKIIVSKEMMDYVETNVCDEKLLKLLKSNFSNLFLSSYGDYINGIDELGTNLEENSFVLKYNTGKFGKLAFRMTKLFGFEVGSRIVRGIVKVKRILNKG